MNKEQRDQVEIIRSNVERGYSDNRDVFKLLAIIDSMNTPPDAIYIAGPMTGYKNYNRETFKEYATMMRDSGYTVNNPGEVNIPDGEYHDYMRTDLRMMIESKEIHALPGWEKSNGVGIEAIVAAVCRIPFYNAGDLGPAVKRIHLLLAGIRAIGSLLQEVVREEAKDAESNR